jgi:outer membrane protein
MRKAAFIIIVLIFGVMMQASAQKTLKIGHVNMDSIAQLMPEVDSMKAAIETRKNIQQKTLRIEEENLNNLYISYSNNMEGMPQSWIDAKQDELIKKQQAIETLKKVDFPGELQDIQEVYLQKMYDKIMDAVKILAQELNYTYVFNSGEGLSGVLYAAPSEDITGLVIKKLNLTIKPAEKPATPATEPAPSTPKQGGTK